GAATSQEPTTKRTHTSSKSWAVALCYLVLLLAAAKPLFASGAFPYQTANCATAGYTACSGESTAKVSTPAFSSANIGGNLIVVGIFYATSSTTPLSVSDSAGN